MKTDNYIKNLKIVSYDSKKTWIEIVNNKIIFCKKSTLSEYNAQVNMKKILLNRIIVINNKNYKIDCPSIYCMKDKTIYMEYFDGINLELMLKDKESHNLGVMYLNELIKYLVKNKIYWIDFAPRNILISNNNIMIVDFEKGILNKKSTLVDYLRNHVYEEYSLFLFKEERIFRNIDIFKSDKNIDVIIDEIESPRYKCIAKLLGYDEIISYQKYLDILKLIIEVETPYVKDKKFVFPGEKLDELIINNIDNNPFEIYSKEVLRLAKLTDRCIK